MVDTFLFVTTSALEPDPKLMRNELRMVEFRRLTLSSGNITDDIVMRYLDRHTHKDGFSRST